MIKIYITVTLFFISFLSFGQGTQVGLSFGLSNYQGDIASSKIWSPRDFNASASLFIRKKISNQWNFKTNLLFTKLSGNDAKHLDEGQWRARRNYWFKTALQELTVIGEWNFLDRKMINRRIHPYLSFGAGLLFSKPTDQRMNTDFVIPIGLGFNIDVKEHLLIGLELSTHNPFSDQLDGFSDEGFSDGNDYFNLAVINIAFKLGKQGEAEQPKF